MEFHVQCAKTYTRFMVYLDTAMIDTEKTCVHLIRHLLQTTFFVGPLANPCKTLRSELMFWHMVGHSFGSFGCYIAQKLWSRTVLKRSAADVVYVMLFVLNVCLLCGGGNAIMISNCDRSYYVSITSRDAAVVVERLMRACITCRVQRVYV